LLALLISERLGENKDLNSAGSDFCDKTFVTHFDARNRLVTSVLCLKNLMKLPLGWFLFFSIIYGGYGQSSEFFSESLKITPFADGRVSTTFSFDTVLEGASPRDPRSLSSQDACKRVFPCACYFSC
jgi:hypothetical protein